MYVFLFLFPRLSSLEYVFTRSIFWCSEKRNEHKIKYLLESMKRRSIVHQNYMSREYVSNIDQWKLFSEDYKPITITLCLVNKITANNCCSQLYVSVGNISYSESNLRKGFYRVVSHFSLLSFWCCKSFT